MTYYPRATIIRERWQSGEEYCADPRETVATAACCAERTSSTADPLCAYKGERVTLATAEERCAAAGATMCDYVWARDDCGSTTYFWADAPCSLRAQINSEGFVSVVHNMSSGGAEGGTPLRVRPNSGNVFRAAWSDDDYPTAAAGCAPADACVAYGETCMCNITVSETAVFTDADNVPTRDEILSTLKIGGVEPATFDAGTFTSVAFHDGDVIVYSRVADDDVVPTPTPAPTLGDWNGRVFNVTLTPTDDGYVNTWSCCSTHSYGSNSRLRLKQTSRAVYLSYVRFKVQSERLALLEQRNYTFALRAATLRLQTYEGPLADTTVYHVGNSSFHEGNLTFDSAPSPKSYSSDPPASLVLAFRENLGVNFTDFIGWENFELEVDVLGGVGVPVAHGDRFAFQLRSSDSDAVSYSSKEGDGPPELVLELEAARPTARPTRSPAPTRLPTPSPTTTPTASLAPTTVASRVALDSETIFEVAGADGGREFYRNLASAVRIDGDGASYAFRNAPHFVSLVDVEMTARDAAHETEAVLDHLLDHPNTPPFVAHRLIQRFTNSNPSPRYVETVATAFKTGNFTVANGSVAFGTGRRGDLAATIAAILLDREARETVLDHDRAHGRLQEPLLKVLHFMRSMEFESRSGREIELTYMDDVIGQSSFKSPTVFNFVSSRFAMTVRAC